MKFTELSAEDRNDIITRVTATLKMQGANIVEKDWWVTQILRALFALPYSDHISFKGGTSLSKCWHLIDRFSEDIDIAIDREFLGFSGALSRTQISDKLRRTACSFVREQLQFDIKTQLVGQGIGSEHFDVKMNITTITTTDPEVVNIEYHPVIRNIAIKDDDYILPKIKIEVSGRSMAEPISEVTIDSFIDQVYANAPFAEKKFAVRAVLPKRTFLEKVFLLHEEFAKPQATIRVDRMSRHLYDIGEMMNTAIVDEALNDEVLYRSVIQHRKTFIGLKGFDYATLYPATVNIVPPKEVAKKWEDDYAKMQSMIYRESPAYDRLIERISELNERIRQLDYHP